METHSSILAWRIPWTEEPGGLQFMGREESGTTEQVTFHFSSLKKIPLDSGITRYQKEFFFFFLALLYSLWDYSSPARD